VKYLVGFLLMFSSAAMAMPSSPDSSLRIDVSEPMVFIEGVQAQFKINVVSSSSSQVWLESIDLPVGATLDPETHILSWKPDYQTVTDDKGMVTKKINIYSYTGQDPVIYAQSEAELRVLNKSVAPEITQLTYDKQVQADKTLKVAIEITLLAGALNSFHLQVAPNQIYVYDDEPSVNVVCENDFTKVDDTHFKINCAVDAKMPEQVKQLSSVHLDVLLASSEGYDTKSLHFKVAPKPAPLPPPKSSPPQPVPTAQPQP